MKPEALRDWYLGDLHALSLSEMTWHRLRVEGPIPYPRFGHTLHVLGSSLVLFGGWPHNNPTRVRLSGPVIEDEQQKEPAAAAAAEGEGNADAAAGDLLQQIVRQVPFSQAAALCSYTGTWKPWLVRGRLPAPRYGHSCTAVPEGLLFVGGWTSPVPQWEVLLLREELPQPHPRRAPIEGPLEGPLEDPSIDGPREGPPAAQGQETQPSPDR